MAVWPGPDSGVTLLCGQGRVRAWSPPSEILIQLVVDVVEVLILFNSNNPDQPIKRELEHLVMDLHSESRKMGL